MFTRCGISIFSNYNKNRKVIVLFLILFTSNLVYAGNTEKAIRAAARASYKQTNLDDKVKKLEKRYLSDEVRKYGGWTINISKIFIEKKVVYTWEF